ncbi:Uncharacterised protein [Halioglobus japonicus]|nr:Uncharacterised protein [Halioglobus japonicus]
MGGPTLRQLEDFEKNVLVETYKSQIAIVVDTLKLLALVNGGGVIAILTLVGSVAGKCESIPEIGGPIKYLVAGLISCFVALIATYFAQMFVFKHMAEEFNEDLMLRHAWSFNVAVFFAVISVGLFGYGSIRAASAYEIFSCLPVAIS